MVILTEGTLFICLFASYYFLGADKNRWDTDTRRPNYSRRSSCWPFWSAAAW